MYKKLFFGLLLALIVAGAIGAGFYFGQKQTNKPSNESFSPSVSPSEKLAVTSKLIEAEDENIVPITANTVSFGRLNTATVLRYRGKVYDESDQFNMEGKAVADEHLYQWYGLVNAPAGVPAGEFMLDEVFGFKVLPDKKSFLFIMRWGTKEGENTNISYYLYYYNPVKDNKLTLVKKFNEGPANIPKIDQINNDGNYASLDMYSCWNCGGHKPETMLLNLSTLKMEGIGKVSYFAWKENGNYEYKEYQVIECVGESMGECFEPPENLPLKTGKFML